MPLTIILDKSAFQALSFQEIITLNNYYEHNVTPILTMEVLGDLSKESKEGKPPSSDRVRDFARKLFPHDIIINKPFYELIAGELSGEFSFNADGRPFLEMKKSVATNDGKKGYVVSETDQQKSVNKWKDGNFEQADYELSHLWREKTHKVNLLEYITLSQKASEKDPSIKEMWDLAPYISTMLDDPNRQEIFLGGLIQKYIKDGETGYIIFQKWVASGRPLLRDFAPYTYFCLGVDMTFLFGLNYGFIGTRATNVVDQEYLYYLPFCRVFTSNDELHNVLAPLLVRRDQTYINIKELKEDLKGIQQVLEQMPEKERSSFYKKPPINESSLTFKLWNKYFDYPERENLYPPLTEKEKRKRIEEMEKFFAAMEGDEVVIGEGEEPDFIVRKTSMGKDDPCLCGSGKPLVGCCMTMEDFIKHAKHKSQL